MDMQPADMLVGGNVSVGGVGVNGSRRSDEANAPAPDQYDNVQGKLASLNVTLGGLERRARQTAAQVNERVSLKTQTDDLTGRAKERWSELTKTQTEQSKLSKQARAAANAATQAIVAADELIADLEQRMATLPLEAKDPTAARWKVPLDAVRKERVTHEAERLAAQRTEEKARKEAVAAEGQLNNTHDPQLAQMVTEADTLLGMSNTLHLDATRGQSLKDVGLEKRDLDKKDLTAARDYHRKLAFINLCATLVLALGVGGAIVTLLFVDTGASHLWIAVSGRVTLAVGGAWLVGYLARLQSRHSQQAVLYQDRLAGWDPANALLYYGSTEERGTVMRQMTKTYLNPGANAFKPWKKEPMQPGIISDKMAGKLIKSLSEKAIAKLVEEIPTRTKAPKDEPKDG